MELAAKVNAYVLVIDSSGASVAVLAGYIISQNQPDVIVSVHIFGGVSFGSDAFHQKLLRNTQKNLRIVRFKSTAEPHTPQGDIMFAR